MPKKLQHLCVACAGVGERNPANCTHDAPDAYRGRTAVRAVFDDAGRWLIQWREADGEEWVGAYRLIPV